MAGGKAGHASLGRAFARRTVAFDVETVPRFTLDQLPPRERERFRRAAEEEVRRTGEPGAGDPAELDRALVRAFSLHPLTSRIVSLALAAPGVEAVLVAAPGAALLPPAMALDERDLLVTFWSVARVASRMIGFNSLRFDLPVLLHRSAMLGVRASTNLLAPTAGRRSRHLDLYDALGAAAPRSARLSLELLGFACGLPAKTAGHGSEVALMVEQQRWPDLARYNLEDARVTAAIYRQLRGTWF